MQMHWNDDAQAALNRAPFFVRGMIRRRVEEYVEEQKRDTVMLEDVEYLREKALPNDNSEELTDSKIEEIIKNTRTQPVSDSRFYEVKACGGAFGCPRLLFDVRSLADRVINIIEESGVPEAVAKRVNGPILRHHKLCVSISGCPNSCSQPQISDFGIQGRARPGAGNEICTNCGECISICREGAITLDGSSPSFNPSKCIDCGDCAAACPTHAINTESTGFSVLLGGKLGRHPQLAHTLFDFTDEAALIISLQVACDLFVNEMGSADRFANTVNRIGLVEIRHRIKLAT